MQKMADFSSGARKAHASKLESHRFLLPSQRKWRREGENTVGSESSRAHSLTRPRRTAFRNPPPRRLSREAARQVARLKRDPAFCRGRRSRTGTAGARTPRTASTGNSGERCRKEAGGSRRVQFASAGSAPQREAEAAPLRLRRLSDTLSRVRRRVLPGNSASCNVACAAEPPERLTLAGIMPVREEQRPASRFGGTHRGRVCRAVHACPLNAQECTEKR